MLRLPYYGLHQVMSVIDVWRSIAVLPCGEKARSGINFLHVKDAGSVPVHP